MPLNHKHITLHKLLRSLLILSFGLMALGSMTAFVVVDCRPQSDKPANTTLCNGIIGGVGDNQITVDKDQTAMGPFFGDGVLGKGGNDTIINNGTTISSGGGTGRNGDIEGDVATGNGGDDVIVNNGMVASDVDGDTALGNGGNDVLINNGTVGDDMDGDNTGKNGGDDLIINNGIVGGDIQADDNEGAANSHGGNDIIVINGTVEGSVYGDAGVKTGGDDGVILQNGANGGDDNDLYINGNGGDDTLAFNFTVPDQATLDDLSKQITDADPMHGSLTYDGQTFTWENFEHLGNQLMLAGQAATRFFVFNQYALAYVDSSGRASGAVYCMFGSLSVMGTDRQGRSEYLFTVKTDKVATIMQQAIDGRKEAQIDVADGQSLWAQPNGELVVYDSFARYQMHFSPGPMMCSEQPQAANGSVK